MAALTASFCNWASRSSSPFTRVVARMGHSAIFSARNALGGEMVGALTGPMVAFAIPAWTEEKTEVAYTPWLKIPAR